MPKNSTLPTLVASLLEKVRLRAAACEAVAAAERARVANAEAVFRRLTKQLVDDIAVIETAHKVAYVVQAHGYDDGRYGMTIQRAADGAICKLSIFDTRYPHVIEWSGTPSGHHYDLEATQAHTSEIGFLRTYEALIDDLAAWMVPYAQQVKSA